MAFAIVSLFYLYQVCHRKREKAIDGEHFFNHLLNRIRKEKVRA